MAESVSQKRHFAASYSTPVPAGSLAADLVGHPTLPDIWLAHCRKWRNQSNSTSPNIMLLYMPPLELPLRATRCCADTSPNHNLKKPNRCGTAIHYRIANAKPTLTVHIGSDSVKRSVVMHGWAQNYQKPNLKPSGGLE